MMTIAAIVGTLSTYIGLLLSYHFDIAAGATIVFTAVMFFALAAVFIEVRKAISKPTDGEHEHPHAHGHVHV
jgi:ABC-type Mn2+/Zn2+ transport system permease subunit